MNEPTTSGDDWPFDQPRNCATITMRQILEGEEPVLAAYHDADDHGWQFIGMTDANVDDGRIVGLGEMVEIDPSLLDIADLEPGWHAVRDARGKPWTRRRTETHDE